MGRYGMNARAPRDGEYVMSLCWCEAEFVWIPVEQVRAGRTERCHSRDCQPPKETT
jgi:hypothetical protein